MRTKRDYVWTVGTIPPGPLAVPPQGAVYVLPDLSHYMTARTTHSMMWNSVKTLSQRHQLAIVPGSMPFGAPGSSPDQLCHVAHRTCHCYGQIAKVFGRNLPAPTRQASGKTNQTPKTSISLSKDVRIDSRVPQFGCSCNRPLHYTNSSHVRTFRCPPIQEFRLCVPSV
jgi:hypothetical protein